MSDFRDVEFGVDRMFDHDRDGRLDTFERVMRDNYLATGNLDFGDDGDNDGGWGDDDDDF